MQSENIDDKSNLNNSKISTPEKVGNEDFTFSKSPIKTPRKIGRFINNQFIKSGILNKNKDEIRNFEKRNENGTNQVERILEKEDKKKLVKKDGEINSNSTEIEIPSLIKQRPLAPKPNTFDADLKEGTITELEENNLDSLSYKKKKKDWKSWSSQEKELFYEAIANGGNYSSLQKLFKNMNNKIGTKSTEKIRDYYYRALKNVNKLLRSVGDSGINRKNRDEVLLALNCYGKMITSSNSKQKSKLEAMKKLNRHPRLFKKTAMSLKKLIMRGVKTMRTRKLCNNANLLNVNKNNKAKQISKNMTFKKEYKINNNQMSNIFPNVKIIDPDGRKIPFEKFTLRLTPYDHETYFKMIECNYSSRFDISIPCNKSLKQLIEILTEKWKNVTKKYKNACLYLCPIEDIWIREEITFFSANDNTQAFDIGDIYASYGFPSTSLILMQYQWNDSPVHVKHYVHINENSFHLSKSALINEGSHNNSNIIQENNQNNYASNSLLAQPTINLQNSPKNNTRINVEDLLNSNESEEDKEKSFIPLEQEYDEFDPLEFLGIYHKDIKLDDRNANSSDVDLDDEFDLAFDENNCRMWEDDEFGIEEFKNISPSESQANININEIGKVLNDEIKHNEDLGEENDPYKRLDFFNKIRNKNEILTNTYSSHNINNEINDSAIAANNFLKNKSNVFSISECDSNLEGGSNMNSKGYLNFQDLNSKIKSNSLTISNSNNFDKATSNINRTPSFNFSKINQDEDCKKPNDNLSNNLETVKDNLTKDIIKNEIATSKEKIIEPSQNKRVKKRIPFTNNNNYIKTNIEKDNALKNNNKSNTNSLITLVKDEEKKETITSPPHAQSPTKINDNVPCNTYLTPFLTNSLHKPKTTDNRITSSFLERKDDIHNFNAENSNIFNYNHDHIGIFGQESNMNFLRNNYNHSLLFTDNMFNSNHMNSIFNKNVEDTMMRRVTNSLDNQKEVHYHYGVSEFKDKILNLNNNNEINKEIPSKKEVKVTSIILSSDNSSMNGDKNRKEGVSEKENKDDKLLSKKTKRKNDSEGKKIDKSKKKRTHPANLDEMLEASEKKTTKSKSKKVKNSEKDLSNICVNNILTPNSNHAQNINISNTNPYIINQNNYFNGFNPPAGVPQIDQNSHLSHPRVYYPQPHTHLFPVDIPHPNNFISSNVGNNLNYQFNTIGITGDPQIMWSNYPHVINRFPIGYYNHPPRPFLPVMNADMYTNNKKNFHPNNQKITSQFSKKPNKK